MQLFLSCKRWSAPLYEEPLPIPTKTWILVWQDELDDFGINSNNWSFDIGSLYGGWGNNELQFYTSRTVNAYIENGNLVIQALKENYGGFNYTSARMKSINKVFLNMAKLRQG